MSHDATARFSFYDDADLMRAQAWNGQHRTVIGGLWEELGSLQLEFLKSRGLQPQHALIDVGAGSFRAGVKLVPYLDPGNYYAIDLQRVLLEAGYTREIEPAGLAGRFPRGNFVVNGSFDISSFQRTFDFGIAQSVFTHMPINRLSDCLAALAPHFRAGGLLFVTVFLANDGEADRPVRQGPDGVVTTPTQDPYHTTVTALREVAARALDWQMIVLGGWAHPRNQQMVCFERTNHGSRPR
jgi:hypothetical protein